jgi:hypothetical protein
LQAGAAYLPRLFLSPDTPVAVCWYRSDRLAISRPVGDDRVVDAFVEFVTDSGDMMIMGGTYEDMQPRPPADHSLAVAQD